MSSFFIVAFSVVSLLFCTFSCCILCGCGCICSWLCHQNLNAEPNAGSDNTRNANIEADLPVGHSHSTNLYIPSIASNVNEIQENNSNEATETIYHINLNIHEQNAVLNCRRSPLIAHTTSSHCNVTPSTSNIAHSSNTNRSDGNVHPHSSHSVPSHLSHNVPSYSSHNVQTSAHQDTTSHRITPLQSPSTDTDSDTSSTGACELYAPD